MDLLNKNIDHDYLCDIIIIAMSKTAIGSTAIGHKYTTIWRIKKIFFHIIDQVVYVLTDYTESEIIQNIQSTRQKN